MTAPREGRLLDTDVTGRRSFYPLPRVFPTFLHREEEITNKQGKNVQSENDHASESKNRLNCPTHVYTGVHTHFRSTLAAGVGSSDEWGAAGWVVQPLLHLLQMLAHTLPFSFDTPDRISNVLGRIRLPGPIP